MGKKLYILKHVQLYIHTLLFIQSQIHPFRTQTISLFSIMIFSVISFEFSNREVENNCNVHSITKFQKKQQHTASAPCFEGDQQCCLLC